MRLPRLRRRPRPGFARARRLGVPALALVSVALAGTGAATLASGGAQRPHRALPPAFAAPAPSVQSLPATPAPTTDHTAAAAPVPAVAPLRARITPDVLVTSTAPLSAAQIAHIEQLAHASSAVAVETARVRLGPGTTLAVGVNPSQFRAFTPPGTAESDPLWQSVARGDAAVAHAVAKALSVPLGAQTPLGVRSQEPIRVGAYATTGLPGVGVVVDAAEGRAIGLTPASGLILAGTGQDPVVVSAVLTKDLGNAVKVIPLRVPATAGHLDWVAPAFGAVSSPFGWRPWPLHPGQREFHEGIDIAASLGAPIYAAADGYVQYAGPASGFGNEVVLQHADGVTTVYGHMATILVTSGPVRAGQPIALVGSLGESTGPHLHFEVHVNDQATDPLAWLEAHGVRVDR